MFLIKEWISKYFYRSSKPSESRQWKNLMKKAGAINIDGCVIGWPSMAGSDK